MAGRNVKGRGVGAFVTLALVLLAVVPLVLHAIRTPDGAAGKLPLDAPIPAAVPAGTTLVVGDPATQRALEYTGWIKELPFKVQWANISGGPAVTEAFQAKAIDVGSAADIPPIHATWVGIPVKIVAFRLRQDPIDHPIYVIGVSPRAKIRSLADLKGKKIAFSPGQAQGAVVLRALHGQGLKPSDVTLVDLPATSDIYSGALAAGQVDAAPIGAGLPAKRYLDDYGKDGARVLNHGPFRDDPSLLYVRTETLRDPAKAAAIRQYVALWARAQQWMFTHSKEWTDIYYVRDQGVSRADAEVIVRDSGQPDIPRNWSGIVALQQETIDFLAREIGRKPFNANDLFDHRFEHVAADAIGHQPASVALLTTDKGKLP